MHESFALCKDSLWLMSSTSSLLFLQPTPRKVGSSVIRGVFLQEEGGKEDLEETGGDNEKAGEQQTGEGRVNFA